ncbi:hypothetical protein RUM43_008076 [Polyplax serrata]|uniref:Protein aurora borealis n=1 Tax=Polyplax serrata TaxID=468196 RepID=A0AAN8PNA0_POLSC
MASSPDTKYTTTPLKSVGNSITIRQQLSGLIKGGNPYKTPVQNRLNSGGDVKLSKTKSYRNVVIKKMPTYSPPSKNVSFVKNPFEHAKLLKERLSQPLCSPSLFKTVSSPAQNDDFTWSIEDISMLRPADIDENPSQDFDSWFSPVTESQAQEAINRFFSSRLADMDSPLKVDVEKKYVKTGEKCNILCEEKSIQTDMTLPPILPPDVEAILSRYCIFRDVNKEINNTLSDADAEMSTPSASEKKLLLSPCQTPEGKIIPGAHVSTPVTSRLSSPEISPVCDISLMDISMRDRASVRMNLSKDIAMCEKEMSNDWNCQGCSTPRAVAHSCDSAFASM